MSKKRKAVYVDRNQILSDSNKLPNVLESTKAEPCESNKHCSLEKRFKNKLVVENDPWVLDAMVMFNDICVLMSKDSLQAVSIKYAGTLNMDGISGKQKKGAQTIKAGYTMCTVDTGVGGLVELRTPVGGKLLEINEALLAHPELLQTHHSSSGYIAVIYPNTEIPSLDSGGCVDYAGLVSRLNSKHAANRSDVCFAFNKGNCARGDKCKFGHEKKDSE